MRGGHARVVDTSHLERTMCVAFDPGLIADDATRVMLRQSRAEALRPTTDEYPFDGKRTSVMTRVDGTRGHTSLCVRYDTTRDDNTHTIRTVCTLYVHVPRTSHSKSP